LLNHHQIFKKSLQLSSKFSLIFLAIALFLVFTPEPNPIAQSPSSLKHSTNEKLPNKISRTPWLLNAVRKWLQPKKRSGGSTSERNLPFGQYPISDSQDPPLPDPPIPLSGAGEEIESLCLSPSFSSEYHYLWTRQPLLLWAKQPLTLQVIDVRSNQIIWQKKDFNSIINQTRLDILLKAGQKYILRAIGNSSLNQNDINIEFQTLDEAQWQQINRDLIAIERQSINQKESHEEIALRKAAYFAERELWGDVQSTILSLRKSTSESGEMSAELRYLIYKFEEAFEQCSRSNEPPIDRF
jgi:hypothetical protein